MLGVTLLERVAARWVLVGGREDQPTGGVLSSLSDELGAWATPVVSAADLDALGSDLDQETGRVVLVGEDIGALECLRLLADRPALRDRIDAVLAISAPLAGVDDPTSPYARARWTDWMAHWFGHAQLDTDCVRQTPYMALQWLDPTVEPPGVVGLPLSEARFPLPGEGPFPMVEVVDLGPLLVSSPPPSDLTAKALVGVVCGWILTRRAS
jgi:pimeloyl-ACP methyl ester carboxylesterase